MDTIIDIVFHDSKPGDFTEATHPRKPDGKFSPTHPAEEKGKGRGRKPASPKNNVIAKIRAKKAKANPHGTKKPVTQLRK